MLNNYEVEILDNLLKETRGSIKDILILAQKGLQEAQNNDNKSSCKVLDNPKVLKSLDRAIKQL